MASFLRNTLAGAVVPSRGQGRREGITFWPDHGHDSATRSVNGIQGPKGWEAKTARVWSQGEQTGSSAGAKLDEAHPTLEASLSPSPPPPSLRSRIRLARRPTRPWFNRQKSTTTSWHDRVSQAARGFADSGGASASCLWFPIFLCLGLFGRLSNERSAWHPI
ncbi:hypothetical protein XA68_15656 [Ophiocordyceps unilateralis]|uniref:Uncharacterized protein n=1 Tax=Ophiocordyceps unilateralis TaxID=268505 RepID=A0A2A9P7Y9_OPHUN|nr:hypothetical protein XA68_15656 [Ophiocordyceps unilateralis]